MIYTDSACPQCSPGRDSPPYQPATSPFQFGPFRPSPAVFWMFRSRTLPASRRARDIHRATELQPAAADIRPRAGRYGLRGVPMPLHGPISPFSPPLSGGVLQPSPYSILAEEPLAVGSVNAVLGRHRERRFGLNRLTPRPDAGDPRGATGPARRAASHCVRRDRTSGIRSRVSGAVGGQLSSLNTDQFGCLSLRRSIRRKSNQRLRCSHI